MSQTSNTTIVHLDVDAFYVCCERELRPELCNRPVVVSQYNPYGNLRDNSITDPARILYDGNAPQAKKNQNVNGSLIAVSYEARARNIKRNDRGLEAISKCPNELCIVQVPVLNGKASLTLYRDASERVMSALADFMKSAALELYKELLSSEENDENNETKSKTSAPKVLKVLSEIKVEKASCDEIYIDISIPVQTIVEECRATSNWGALYSMLTIKNGASTHTTVGGLESSSAAIATNSLSKDDIRKGSSLQVLDSNDAANVEDQAANFWWTRKFPQAWQKEEIYLAVGSLITLKARQAVVEKFDGVYTLSAGVSTNKVMSKLASGLKKPNRQTLINPCDEATLQTLFHPLPIGRIRGLGGKFGDRVEETLKIKTVGELAKVSLATLTEHFEEKQAAFLFRTAQGICDEPVTERTKTKRIGASKTFRGVLSIHSSDHETLKKWITNLVTEVVERTSGDTTRYAKTLTCWLNMSFAGGGKADRRRASQSAPIPRNASEKKCTDAAFQLARDIIGKTSSNSMSDEALLIIGMEISASNFVAIEQGSNSIRDAFERGRSPKKGASASSLQQITTTINETAKVGVRPVATTAGQNVSKGIAAFLKPAVKPENDVTLPTSHQTSNAQSGKFTSSSKKDLFPRDKSAKAGVRDTASGNTSQAAGTDLTEASDLEVAQVLQRQCNMEKPPICSGNGGGETESVDGDNGGDSMPVEAHEADPDLDYARQLQASFDRENEVISSIEERRSSVSSHKSQPSVPRGSKRQGASAQGPSMATFFAKKTKRT